MHLWQLSICHLPDQLIVNAGVAMDHPVSHVINRFSWNFCVRSGKVREFFDNQVRRLTDDFQVAYYAVLQQASAKKLRFSDVFQILCKLFNGLCHVTHIVP